MSKTGWMDRINNEVLRRMSEGKLLWKSIVKRRNEWIRHIIWRKGLLKLIIEESVERIVKEGPRHEYIQRLIRDQRCRDSYVQTKRKADNRVEISRKSIYGLKS